MAVMALALVASLLALAPRPTAAGAQDEEPVTTETSFKTDCFGYAFGVRQYQENEMAFKVTAPKSVAQDDTFTIRIAPMEGFFPDKNEAPPPINEVTVNRLLNIDFMYNLPTNSTLESVEIVPGSGFGTSGTPTVEVNETDYAEPRIVLNVPEVPKNMAPPENNTYFQLPAIDVTVTATGPNGSNIVTRVAGDSEATSGYVFQADSAALADVYCWPQGPTIEQGIAAPPMSQTAIGGGGAAVPTTTDLAVQPTVVPAGNDVTLTANVTAPGGVVRFNDGATVLGYDELDESSEATLVTQLGTIGERSIVAHYLGSPGFEPSSSEPVIVTVTDPADRVATRIAMSTSPARLTAGGTGAVQVSVEPIEAGPDVTGSVRLYDNGKLIGTQLLEAGSVSFAVSPTAGGHMMRAEYAGDVNYDPSAGSVPLPVSASGASDRALTGFIGLNGVTGSAPTPGSALNSTFATDPDGLQTLSGVLVFPTSTLDAPAGGTITGRLAQVGAGAGEIEVGEDAAASFSTELYYQVESADLGSGEMSFEAGCAIGPFDVDLSGTRVGTNGELVLSQTSFAVPFAAPGTCLNEDGTAMAGQVGAAFAGASTELMLELTPPPVGIALEVAPVTVTPAGGSSVGQPVTLSASVSRVDGGNFFFLQGTFNFYSGETFLFGRSANSGFVPAPTFGTSVVFPSGAGVPVPPLPQGTNELRAEFVPNPISDFGGDYYATSPLSEPTIYEVLPPIPKTAPTLTLEVPESARAGEPVAINVELDPAPNSVEAPAPDLVGDIQILDVGGDAAETIPFQPAFGSGQDTIRVTAASDGHFTVETALAPGVHELQAVFVPTLNTAAWWWDNAESDAMPHTVVGDQIPTSLTVVGDSTRGTGAVPLDTNLYLEVQIDPKIYATLGPLTPQVVFIRCFDGGALGYNFNASGVATVTVGADCNDEVGFHEATVSFDPSYRTDSGSLGLAGNQGFAASEVTFSYEVVDPGDPAPMATATEIVSVSPSPVEQGTTWDQVNGYVTYNAAGSVAYTARNVQTADVTPLGSANVSTSTNASSGRGLARLVSPGVTADLPVGTYEVRGAFTPSDPGKFAPSTSETFLVHVIGEDDPVPTVTSLSVTPAGTSSPGGPVVLEATVTPIEFGGGTVTFLDDGEELGVAPTASGSASILVYDLSEGAHSLTAEFAPSNPAIVEGSTSEPVDHVVAEPAIETSTSLSISPEGSSAEGVTVTLTATVEPAEAAGAVTFEDEEGPVGDPIELADGAAVLELDDLPVGEHQFTAAFEAEDPSEYAASISEPIAHTVTEVSVPQAPQDVTATAGGLMATVTWTPGSDGGEPIDGYEVTVSPGDEVLSVSGVVTTVDVIGLEEGADYSFTVVATNGLGSSEPSEPSNTVTVGPPTAEFADVGPDHAFFAEITWMAEVGLSNGYEDGDEHVYLPVADLSRQAMSAFLYRLSGSPDGDAPTCDAAPFDDVPVDHPFCGEIAWMADEGISTGYGDGTYRPADGLSREAMSAFMYRLAGSPDGDKPICEVPPFDDVPTTNAFCGEIAWMAAVGISEGYSDGTFGPTETLTRQAMSAFLYRYTLVEQTVVV